jgi:hypothetical protein
MIAESAIDERRRMAGARPARNATASVRPSLNARAGS